MQQEGSIELKGKHILELGCGIGLLGIYLGILGAEVTMGDLAPMRDIVEKNINLNSELLKNNVNFCILNWYFCPKIGKN